MKTKNQIIKILKSGGIGIMPTDTIYGLLGLATNKKTVQRIYQIKKRQPDKPSIILIGSLADLKLFNIKVDSATQNILKKIWPGQVSVVLPCPSAKWSYLHRGTKTLAFRLPQKKSLREVLVKTGPLIAPSANPEGLSPANNPAEAKKYFSAAVDFYYGRGSLIAPPSTLIKITNGQIEILRPGAVKLKI
ncbi:MAG: L-threonylcarbamoyladenylate synthase [Patescibacteria group bacterium]